MKEEYTISTNLNENEICQLICVYAKRLDPWALERTDKVYFGWNLKRLIELSQLWKETCWNKK